MSRRYFLLVAMIAGGCGPSVDETTFPAGYRAGKIGQPPTCCPYSAGLHREGWMKGWSQGDEERRQAEAKAPSPKGE